MIVTQVYRILSKSDPTHFLDSNTRSIWFFKHHAERRLKQARWPKDYEIVTYELKEVQP